MKILEAILDFTLSISLSLSLPLALRRNSPIDKTWLRSSTKKRQNKRLECAMRKLVLVFNVASSLGRIASIGRRPLRLSKKACTSPVNANQRTPPSLLIAAGWTFFWLCFCFLVHSAANPLVSLSNVFVTECVRVCASKCVYVLKRFQTPPQVYRFCKDSPSHTRHHARTGNLSRIVFFVRCEGSSPNSKPTTPWRWCAIAVLPLCSRCSSVSARFLASATSA